VVEGEGSFSAKAEYAGQDRWSWIMFIDSWLLPRGTVPFRYRRLRLQRHECSAYIQLATVSWLRALSPLLG
jgi:hypothetical protein